MRPLPITVLCIILFLVGALNLIGVVLSFFHFSLGRVLWILATTSAALVSFWGLWRMKRWAVFLYLGGYALGVLTFYMFPPERADLLNRPFLMLLVPLIYSAIVFPYWKRLA